MSDLSFIESPVLATQSLKVMGKAVPDPLGSSTVYYVPDPEELKLLNTQYFEEISLAEEDMKPLRAKAYTNERSYYLMDDSPDGAYFVYPLVKREVDFNTGWLVSTITRPEPVFSFDPVEDREYTVISSDEMGNIGTTMVGAERAAQEMEISIEHLVRDVFKISSFLRTVVKELKMGKGPVWVKLGYNPYERYERVPKVKKTEDGLGVVVTSGEWAKKSDNFPIKWIPKSIYDMLYRVGYDDYEDLPWIGEKCPMSQGKYADLVTHYEPVYLIPEDKRKAALEVGPIQNTEREQSQALQSNMPVRQPNGIDIIELYFPHPVRYKVLDEAGKEVPMVEIMQMGGYYHVGLQSFVCIWFNDFDYQDKPYVPFFNDKVPFQLADTSSADELRPIQAWIVEALTLGLENKALANNSGFLIDEDSPSWDWFGSHRLEPGFRAPGKKDDVTPITFGRDASTLLPEIEWLINKADRIGDVRRGERVPGRTSPNTVAQIMQSAVNQDMLSLQSAEESLKKLLRMTLSLYRQIKPEGATVTVPTEGGTYAEFPLRVPLDIDLNSLRVKLTAASEMAQRESGFEDLMMMSDKLDQDSRVTAEITKALVDARLTEGLAQAFERMVERKQAILDAIFSKVRIDSRKMTVSRDILDLIRQDREMIKQQLAQAQAQGGMNGGGGQPPTGAVPGGTGQGPMGANGGGAVPA